MPRPRRIGFRVRTLMVLVALAAGFLAWQVRTGPDYVVEGPDVLVIEVPGAPSGRLIAGKRPVRSDGTVALGDYGPVYVDGLTAAEIQKKIGIHLKTLLSKDARGALSAADLDGVRVRVSHSHRLSLISFHLDFWRHTWRRLIRRGRSPV